MLGDEMNSYAGFLPKGHERVGPGHWVTGMTMQRKRRRWGAEAQELGDTKLRRWVLLSIVVEPKMAFKKECRSQRS